jgi:MHS family shikimate/dehydroshikimate transporter-like MFS transporter
VYILTVFLVVYATGKLGLSRAQMLNAIVAAAIVEVLTIPLFGYLSDRIGRRSLYFFGVAFTVCFAFPLFWMVDTRQLPIITLAVILALSFGHGSMFGLQSAYFPELFATRVRYSGASVGFQLAAAIGGGLAPLLAAGLEGYMGSTGGVSLLLISLALVTLVATLLAPESRGAALDR